MDGHSDHAPARRAPPLPPVPRPHLTREGGSDKWRSGLAAAESAAIRTRQCVCVLLGVGVRWSGPPLGWILHCGPSAQAPCGPHVRRRRRRLRRVYTRGEANQRRFVGTAAGYGVPALCQPAPPCGGPSHALSKSIQTAPAALWDGAQRRSHSTSSPRRRVKPDTLMTFDLDHPGVVNGDLDGPEFEPRNRCRDRIDNLLG